MHGNLIYENDTIQLKDTHVFMLLQQYTFYTWLITICVYILFSVICIYCIMVGIICDFGYGSKGLNKRIYQAQIWPRIQFVAAMLLVKLPIDIFKFIRLV